MRGAETGLIGIEVLGTALGRAPDSKALGHLRETKTEGLTGIVGGTPLEPHWLIP